MMSTKIQNSSRFPTDGTFRSSALLQTDLYIRLESALAGNESPIALGIKCAIANQTPAALIIKTIKEMAADNFKMVAATIGELLTQKIVNHD